MYRLSALLGFVWRLNHYGEFPAQKASNAGLGGFFAVSLVTIRTNNREPTPLKARVTCLAFNTWYTRTASRILI